MALAQNPAMVQMLSQFMTNPQNTAPILQTATQPTVEKSGKAINFKNFFHSLDSMTRLPLVAASGNGGKTEDTMKDALGFDANKRMFGGTTVTQPKQGLLINQAPALYWGSLINQQQQPKMF